MNFLLALALLFSVNPKDWHQDLRKATFALYERSYDSDEKKWNSRFICSAIAIKEDRDGYYLITAGHCFEDYDRKGVKYYVSEESLTDPTLQTVDVIKFVNNDKFDYALLYLDTPRKYPVFKPDLGPLPPAETAVVNVNFSFGLTKQTSKGFVASGIMKSDEGGNHCSDCAGRFVATLGIGPGASGSAVVREDTHEIIGLVEAVFPGYAIGTLAVPMGKTFDDFMVDGSLMEKPPVETPKAKPVPKSKPKIWFLKRWWLRFWHWIHPPPPPPPKFEFIF